MNWGRGSSGASLSECFGVEARDFVVFHREGNFNRLAAHFAVFDVALAAHGHVEQHRYAFAAIGAGEEVLHAASIAVAAAYRAADGEGLKKFRFLNL